MFVRVKSFDIFLAIYSLHKALTPIKRKTSSHEEMACFIVADFFGVVSSAIISRGWFYFLCSIPTFP